MTDGNVPQEDTSGADNPKPVHDSAKDMAKSASRAVGELFEQSTDKKDDDDGFNIRLLRVLMTALSSLGLLWLFRKLFDQ